MKTLLILRHAKAETPHDHQTDFDRALAPRGLKAAARIGELLLAEHLVPDLILSSTATRARQTSAIVVKECDFAGRMEMVGDLYLARPQAYLSALHREGEPHHSAMVVGHNPGLEDLLHLLTGVSEIMPTACLAIVKAPISSWSELAFDAGYELAQLIRPREL